MRSLPTVNYFVYDNEDRDRPEEPNVLLEYRLTDQKQNGNRKSQKYDGPLGFF